MTAKDLRDEYEEIYPLIMGYREVEYSEWLERRVIETVEPVNVDLGDVMFSVCNDYVDGINMDCAKCGEPKYKHLTFSIRIEAYK